MTDQIITINAAEEGYPTLKDSLMLKAPTYRDLRNARQRYPYVTREGERGVGYSVDELLLALCFVGVNGQPFPENSRDAIDRVRILEIADRQFFNLQFKEAFLLTDELVKMAQALATNLKFSEPPRLTYTIPADKMPSGSVSCTFNRPNTGTQLDADRSHKGIPVHGCTFEEYLFAACLSEIDGKSLEPTNDVISVLDNWSPDDVGFANTVFINMFVLDDSASEKAKKSGASLRERRFTKTTATPKKGTAIPPTAN